MKHKFIHHNLKLLRVVLALGLVRRPPKPMAAALVLHMDTATRFLLFGCSALRALCDDFFDCKKRNRKPLKLLGSHAGHQEVSRCHTRGEPEESVGQRLQSMQVNESTLVFESYGRCHQKSETGVSVTSQKGRISSKI